MNKPHATHNAGKTGGTARRVLDPEARTRRELAETPVPRSVPQAMSRSGRIVLAHGGGGQLTDELIHRSVLPRLGNDLLNELLDAAVVDVGASQRLAMTIDSYVVQPWRFPGGDIGRLAVCGTVNDLAVCGARPMGLALAMIVSEGLAVADVEAVLDSIAAAAAEAGVRVVTGDTKVIGRRVDARQAGDGQSAAGDIFLTTAGVGLVPVERQLSPTQVRPGDRLLINGPVGDHGLAVMLAREMPEVGSPLRSDAAPLNGLIESVLDAHGDAVAFMRDPTRGGLSGLCADLAKQSGRHVVLEEDAIAVQPAAEHAAEMLGLDPLEIANEGKVVLAVREAAVEAVLATMRAHPLGREAAAIGHVQGQDDGVCELRTALGGRRVIVKPYGEQLPRIC